MPSTGSTSIQIIGFATEFFTLWDMWTETIYVMAPSGQYHPSHNIDHYSYIKNISTDREKVNALYPGLPFDENLRGQMRNFDVKRDEDLSPEIIKFGKHYGKHIEQIAAEDFSYMLWLLDNCRNQATKALCEQLPQVVEYYARMEQERQAIIDSWKVLESGVHEVTFTCNPNRQVCDTLIPEDNTDNENPLAQYSHRFYAACGMAQEYHTLYILMDGIQHVDGMYPYNMGMINGKAKRLKNKSFKLNLNIFHTIKTQSICHQFATIISK